MVLLSPSVKRSDGKWRDKKSGNYWSSTTNADNTDNALNVNFNNGNVDNNDKDNDNYVRAVRAGEWFILRGCLSQVEDGMEGSIFDFSNIYRQYLKCRRRKRNTINALKFELKGEENCLRLEKELKERTYLPSRSILFVAQRPKPREIFAADFRDRVVHHILVGYLEKIWEPKFIYDSYACRKKKGLHRAVKRLQSFMRKASDNGRKRAYYMQLDVESFFIHIDKRILYDLIKKKVGSEEVLWLARKVIFHDPCQNYIRKDKEGLLERIPSHKRLLDAPEGKGLPIGNLSSQFFANLYLNELDQFIKHRLKIKYYLRYGDDMVILNKNREKLKEHKEEIAKFLEEHLGLSLHPKRQTLQPVSNGADFLGYVVYPDHLLCRKRVINNFRSKLREYQRRLVPYANGRLVVNLDYPLIEKARATVASYLGHLKWANSYHLKEKIFKEFSFLRYFFYPSAKRSDGRLKRRYSIPLLNSVF